VFYCICKQVTAYCDVALIFNIQKCLKVSLPVEFEAVLLTLRLTVAGQKEDFDFDESQFARKQWIAKQMKNRLV
jgi:hypothetical protein